MKILHQKISILLLLMATLLIADDTKSPPIHPFERDNGYFFAQFNIINKAFYYLFRDDKEALKTILETKIFDPLEETKVLWGRTDGMNNGTYSLLSAAIRDEKFYAVQMIVERLNEQQLQSDYLKMILYHSAGKKNLEIYRYLLSKNIAPSYTNPYGENLLNSVTQYGTLEDVKFLLDAGVRVQCGEKNNIITAAMYGGHFDTALYVFKNYPCDVNQRLDERYFTSYLYYLYWADTEKKVDMEVVNYLLDTVSAEHLHTHAKIFLERLQKFNPKLYEIVMKHPRFEAK